MSHLRLKRILGCDERRRRATATHDPIMVMLVVNMNTGIKNFEYFNAVFGNMIQNEVLLSDDMLEIEEENDKFSEVVLRAIDSETHLTKYTDAKEFIKKKYELENKLTKIQKESKCVGTIESLRKDQIELLRMYEQ